MSRDNQTGNPTGQPPRDKRRVHFADTPPVARDDAFVMVATPPPETTAKVNFNDALIKEITKYGEDYHAFSKTPAGIINLTTLKTTLENFTKEYDRKHAFRFEKSLTPKGREQLVKEIGKIISTGGLNEEDIRAQITKSITKLTSDKTLLMDDEEIVRKTISKRVAEELICGANPGRFAKTFNSAAIGVLSGAITAIILAKGGVSAIALHNLATLSQDGITALKTELLTTLEPHKAQLLEAAKRPEEVTSITSAAFLPVLQRLHTAPPTQSAQEARSAVPATQPDFLMDASQTLAAMQADLEKLRASRNQEQVTQAKPAAPSSGTGTSGIATANKRKTPEVAVATATPEDLLVQERQRRAARTRGENEKFSHSLAADVEYYLTTKHNKTISDKGVAPPGSISQYTIQHTCECLTVNSFVLIPGLSEWDMVAMERRFTDEGRAHLIKEAAEAIIAHEKGLADIQLITVTTKQMAASEKLLHPSDRANNIIERLSSDPSLFMKNDALISKSISTPIAEELINKGTSPLTKMMNSSRVKAVSDFLTASIKETLTNSRTEYETCMTRIMEFTPAEISALNTKLAASIDAERTKHPNQPITTTLNQEVFASMFMRAFNEVKPELAYPEPIIAKKAQSRPVVGTQTARLHTQQQNQPPGRPF